MKLIATHVHTKLSDGILSLEETIKSAKTKGISGIFITEHDDCYYHGALERIGRQHKIKIGYGIEISVRHNDFEMHLIGLGIKPNTDSIINYKKQNTKSRYERNSLLIDKIINLYGDLPNEFGQKVKISKKNILDRLKQNATRGELIDKIAELYPHLKIPLQNIRTDPFLYVKRQKISLKEGISLIKNSSGVPILAHPALIKTDSRSYLTNEEIYKQIFPLIKNLGVIAVECDYPYDVNPRDGTKRKLLYTITDENKNLFLESKEITKEESRALCENVKKIATKFNFILLNSGDDHRGEFELKYLNTHKKISQLEEKAGIKSLFAYEP